MPTCLKMYSSSRPTLCRMNFRWLAPSITAISSISKSCFLFCTESSAPSLELYASLASILVITGLDPAVNCASITFPRSVSLNFILPFHLQSDFFMFGNRWRKIFLHQIRTVNLVDQHKSKMGYPDFSEIILCNP